jgi:amidophosphoribosyltransferase
MFRTPQHNVDGRLFRHSNVYGIDMPSPTELVAHGRTTEEIASVIGADLVIFQTLPDLVSSVRRFNPSIQNFDCSVFNGEYVTGSVDRNYLEHLDQVRSDNAKAKQVPSGIASEHNSRPQSPFPSCNGPMNGADDTIGLHNSWVAQPKREILDRSLVS